MFKKTSIALLVFLNIFLLSPALTSATGTLCTKYASGVCIEGPCASAAESAVCQQAAQQDADANNTDPVSGDNGLIQRAINLIAGVTGIVAVILIIVSGMNLITSGGNSENVKKAKSKILAALIGLVVIVLSWTILSFVTERIIK